jgi:penicillin amidase
VIVPAQTTGLAAVQGSFLNGSRQFKELSGYLGLDCGSNNWVVDGSLTASGKPILANDPHLGIQMPSLWYEVHLVAGTLDVIGSSFPGCPGVVIGHNNSIAWGMTNSRVDVQDLYVERINQTGQYEYMGKWYDLTHLKEQISVKGWNEPYVLTVWFTNHGPLLPSEHDPALSQVALRWTALEGGSMFTSLHLLNRAEDWEEFRAALRCWDSPPQNFVYADVEGNIGYQLPGVIPIRSRGQGLMPVPGWTGEYEWSGYVPFEELPSAYNPPGHFLVTANNKIVSDEYPYFLSANWADPSRAQRIIQLLESKKGLTVADMRDIQADTYSLAAANVMPYVLALGPEGWLQERAFRFFDHWDYQMRPESGAAGIADVVMWRTLVNTFGDELADVEVEPGSWASTAQALFKILDEPDNPWFDDVTTEGIEARDQILRRSVNEAMEFWRRRYGDLVGNLDSQWAWGKVHTATFAHVLGSVPALAPLLNRGPVAIPGTWCTVNANAYYPGSFEAVAIPSYRQAVAVGDWTNSLFQHTTGQSGQPLSGHYDDMIGAWQSVQPQPMLYERTAILARAQGVLVLAPAR